MVWGTEFTVLLVIVLLFSFFFLHA
jgi:hypothetical protein